MKMSEVQKLLDENGIEYSLSIELSRSEFYRKKGFRPTDDTGAFHLLTIIPSVATTAPIKPDFLYPVKVAQLIAMGPGADSAITVISIISSWVIHCLFVTQVFSIIASMAYPPPKVNSPIFIIDTNS